MVRKTKVEQVRMAGEDHAVITLRTNRKAGERVLHRREPCKQCPWRKDATGVFPAEAFKHSAPTSYDASLSTFACHESGKVKPQTCAGFLLRNANNNISVRMSGIRREDVSDGGHELHASYRDMAIANGVDPDDPVLEPCRANDE